MVDMAEERVGEPKQRKAISSAKRTRLEEAFKRAGKKPTGPLDFDFAVELLAQCVLGDPGNPTYVRVYLENLQKKFQNNKLGSFCGVEVGCQPVETCQVAVVGVDRSRGCHVGRGVFGLRALQRISACREELSLKSNC